MTIRTFQPGDELAQVSIYNEAAADEVKFKPATLDEVRRRCRAADFDPASRFFALDEGGRLVAYAGFQNNGRVSFPWCRKGHEHHQGPLLQQVLSAMKAHGLTRAFAAYRTDWTIPRDFFLAQGFTQTREVFNFVLDLNEMPTPAARVATSITPLAPTDVPAFLAHVPQLAPLSAAELERHLFKNASFTPDCLFAVRGRTDDKVVAVGVVVENPAFAHPKQVDAAMPCFRLGAFGSEGLTTKRINGLFSFVVTEPRDVSALGVDLLGHAAARLSETEVETVAAQVLSDAVHLVRFYKQFFRHQGRFPLFEKTL